MRNFTLRDGNHIREQLLTLSDRDYVSTYCILDATLPMQRYVATVTLKRVTDGDRTFWHWESTFDVPRGREREFARPRGQGRLRRRLRRACAPTCAARRRARAAPAGEAIAGPRHARVALRRARRCWSPAHDRRARRPGRGEVRVRHTAIGVNYIDVYVRRGEYRMLEPPAAPGMEAAGVVVDVGEGVRPPAAGRSRRLRVHAAGRVRRRAHARAPTGRRAARRHRRRDGRGADAEGHERRVPAASHASRARRRHRAGARRGRRPRPAACAAGRRRSARA